MDDAGSIQPRGSAPPSLRGRERRQPDDIDSWRCAGEDQPFYVSSSRSRRPLSPPQRRSHGYESAHIRRSYRRRIRGRVLERRRRGVRRAAALNSARGESWFFSTHQPARAIDVRDAARTTRALERPAALPRSRIKSRCAETSRSPGTHAKAQLAHYALSTIATSGFRGGTEPSAVRHDNTPDTSFFQGAQARS